MFCVPFLCVCVHKYTHSLTHALTHTHVRTHTKQALAHALATWGGTSGTDINPSSSLHARTTNNINLNLEGDSEKEETAALVAACRAPLLPPTRPTPEALTAASAAYKHALSHPQLGAAWVDGWREWGEVLWLQGKKRAARRCLGMVVERFGPQRLGPATTVGAWVEEGE